MKNTSKRIVSILAVCLLSFAFTSQLYAQEEKTEDKRPVRSPFDCTLLIDNPTYVNPYKGGLELLIHHRFGKFGNGASDLWGIYAPSNIRVGLQYGITDKLAVGIGTEKNNKLQDVHWKYNILNQTRDGSIPVAIAYYGAAVIDGRDTSVFGVNYKFTNRLSYFHEIIVGRKFSNKLSLQAACGYAHFNAVDSFNSNDYLAVSVGGRYKLWGSNSLIFEYDLPVAMSEETYSILPKSNYAIGLEISTSTHAFQVFIASFDKILSQKNFGYNQNDFFAGDILIGFNITVRMF
ncbi:MAG: hypothetical protein ISR55_03770 [Bacteroidetes bacterium]|nr:hypothetical protein [Bacteroidota bacterium]